MLMAMVPLRVYLLSMMSMPSLLPVAGAPVLLLPVLSMRSSLSVAGVPVLLLVLLLLLPLHRRQSPPALDLRWCLGRALLPNE